MTPTMQLGHTVVEGGTDELAVLAHRLLNSFTVVSGRAATLRDHWDLLPLDQRSRWLAEIERAALDVAGLLGVLARGLPGEVTAELATAS